jgi:uncharacterized protein (DUF1810 family)
MSEVIADPYNLDRFVTAQARDYASALSELKGGRKRTHWMWYIFPQLAGLGASSNATYYAISGLEEADAYLRHPVVGPRLLECAEAVIGIEGRSAKEIFGCPDDRKLQSSATLFASVSSPDSVFHRLLVKYYRGTFDKLTIKLLKPRKAR